MKINFFTALVFVFSLFLSEIIVAQNVRFSVQGNTNYSLIKTIDHTSKSQITRIPSAVGYTSYILSNYSLKEKYESQVGGNLKGNIEISINNNFYIKSGLGLNLVRFKKKTEITQHNGLDVLEFGENWDSIHVVQSPGVFVLSNVSPRGGDIILNNEVDPKFGQTNLLYLDIPVMAGYSFFKSRLNVRLGITASLLAYSEVYAYEYDGSRISLFKNTSSDGINNMMLSGNAEVSYRVWKNIALTANYNRQFNNIYDSGSKAKNQNVGLGIEFRFVPKPILAIQ